MQVNPISTEWDGKICDMLLSQRKIQKVSRCKAVNVFNNAYRINVYNKSYTDDGLEKERMIYSCFAKLDSKDTLRIVSEPSGMVL